MPTFGEQLVPWTARIAFVFYIIAEASFVRRFPRQSSWFRRWWTLAWLAFLIHVAAAFHVVHGWSHAAAFADTAERTNAMVGINWGGGLYFNDLMVLLWTYDILRIRRTKKTGCWPIKTFDIAWHIFAAFLWVNAAIVFAPPQGRWLGLIGFGILGGLTTRRAFAQNPGSGGVGP
ncbi:MAG: hypothetical protein KDA80_06025 [Planctomycetaceae bacterium]|nr:hypothetical protein [Planctomycetaceae bacterium]